MRCPTSLRGSGAGSADLDAGAIGQLGDEGLERRAQSVGALPHDCYRGEQRVLPVLLDPVRHLVQQVRLQEPVYVDSIPPCNHACPAGENIQAWLDKAQAGKFEEAWRILVENNPMPSVHGRVCYHPCESACNRGQVDQPVSIHAVERFLGDLALENGWLPEITAEPSGRKILVIGAGPSGLSAAWHLALKGHEVEIRDAGPMAGGMMRFGIPAFRMPRDILDAEIDRIVKLGVKLTLDHKVEDVLREKEEGGFDAVFMAIGAHVGKHVDIPARDSGAILDAVSYLKSVEEGDEPRLGRRVAVYGATRLGSGRPVHVAARTDDQCAGIRSDPRRANAWSGVRW